MSLHLLRHKDSSIYYYNRRIPKGLTELHEGKSREYFSLNTKDKRIAEVLARQWDVSFDKKWALHLNKVTTLPNISTPLDIPIEVSEVLTESKLKEILSQLLATHQSTSTQDNSNKQSQLDSARYTLDEAFESWKIQKTRPDSTTKEWESTIVLFKEMHGDIPVVEITKAHIAKFRDSFLLKNNKAATVRKRLAGIKSILNMAVDYGKIDYNPALGINVARTPMDNLRQEYELSDLKVIFSCPIYTENYRPDHIGEAAYWVPLIALCTGARLKEILQLTPKDIIRDNATGIYFFDFHNRGEGNSLKTRVSLRQVPVHNKLLKLGLLDYLKGLNGSPKLFPKVTSSNSYSQWWARYTRRIGVWVENSKVFHSFRHTFISTARACGIPEDYRGILEGHSTGKGSAKDYGMYSLESKNKWLQKIHYKGLDLSHIIK